MSVLAAGESRAEAASAKTVVVSTASQFSDDMLVREARRCTSNFGAMERQYGLPNQILGSIAVAESGRWHPTRNIRIPWPWTINAEGKGHYFSTKAEAIRTVRQLQEKGVKSIDVGCMQVNLVHHAHAFQSLDQAFDPYYNVSYAARFLRSNYDESRSWPTAIGYYHSRTPERGKPYASRVMNYWREHLDRARLLAGAGGMTELPLMPEDAQGKESAREAALQERRKSKILVVSPDGKATASTLESTQHGVKVTRGIVRPAKAETQLASAAEPSLEKATPSSIAGAKVVISRGKSASAPAQPQDQESLMQAMSEQARQVSVQDYKPKLGPKIIRVTPSRHELVRRDGDARFVFEN